MNDHVLLLEIKFISLPTIRVSTAQYDVTVTGKKFNSVGDVISVSNSTVQRGMKTNATKITLAGEAANYITAINENAYVDGHIKMMMVEIDDTGKTVDSYIVSRGTMNKPTVSKKSKGMKIEIEILPVFIKCERTTGTFPIDSLHQMRSGGDTIFEYVPEARSLVK